MIFPESFIVKSFEFKSAKNVLSSESLDKKLIYRALPGQRWDAQFRIDVAPWNVAEARAVLFALQDDDEVLSYTDPTWVTTVGNKAVGQNESAGQTVVQVNTSNLVRGMMFNFTNHAKLYMIKSVGSGSIAIFPELITAITTLDQLQLATPTVDLELSDSLKRDASLAGTLTRELSRINLRMTERLT